ncbi:Uu.00g090020.m01.CDS01 [Anthostomella pinea]|uniref:Uu.00g090020.m01.CDS01 n=1 Tax=Anthostomella pinea TaxID=933095 RepID=A0AAI8YK44_9PEZI|nr:Uu.00g090020.m01.CDS01 [Anthostomella pinea]
MVQYIHTPWRDRQELLRVRQHIYPSSSSSSPTPSSTSANASANNHSNNDFDGRSEADDDDDDNDERETTERGQQHAVSRVSMWMQRGGCPHLVESTALLTAAILGDVHETRGARASSSAYALRAAYSAAFSRFVTGLLDSQQDKQRKLSMYALAKTIGLPATFVELRHQATHEQLPSLSKLRSAARKALAWIWDYYWKNLTTQVEGEEEEGDGGVEKADPCREMLLRCLREDEAMEDEVLEKLRSRWDDAVLLRTLADVGEASEEPRIILRSLQLSRGILDGSLASSPPAADPDSTWVPVQRDFDAVRAELESLENQLDSAGAAEIQSAERVVVPAAPGEAPAQTKGWARYQGTWRPKPIGVV